MTFLNSRLKVRRARLICLLVILWSLPGLAVAAEAPIRFGLTAVVVTENLRFLDQWSEYLARKLGRDVELVLRHSYREVTDLLNSGVIDFAWICGFPYVEQKRQRNIRLLTVPVYRGAPRYHSYIIVPRGSSDKRFSDLQGKIFAYSDPDSNSGFLYPLDLILARQGRPTTFFRQSFFTFNHAETVQAVAEQFADGGAVDSYIWEYLASTRPEMTERTRIIEKSPSFGFPPVVARVDADPAIARLMKATLESMNRDETGKALLARLKLDGFGDYPDSLFDEIRRMASRVRSEGTDYGLLERVE